MDQFMLKLLENRIREVFDLIVPPSFQPQLCLTQCVANRNAYKYLSIKEQINEFLC